MRVAKARLLSFWVLGCILVSSSAAAQDVHPLMTSKYWGNLGVYFAARNFEASANGSVLGQNRDLDFEGAFGLDDGPDLFMGELGWQFGEKWGLGLQYFQSKRDASKTLEETFEWEDVTYNAGVDIRAGTDVSITRIVFSRRFWDGGPHSVRIGAGIHWLELGAKIAGQATLNDMSTEFRTNSVSASAPVPNIGAWYRYSPSDRWLLSARIDWLSASIDEYSGGIWNSSVGANYRLSQHFGVGAAYQLFQLDGSVKNSNWRGDIQVRFSGPHLYVSGFW